MTSFVYSDYTFKDRGNDIKWSNREAMLVPGINVNTSFMFSNPGIIVYLSPVHSYLCK